MTAAEHFARLKFHLASKGRLKARIDLLAAAAGVFMLSALTACGGKSVPSTPHDAGPGATSDAAQLVGGAACRLPSFPAPALAIPPRSTVADSCAIGASGATTWVYPTNPNGVIVDDSWRIVGRWAICGAPIAQVPAHAAIELGGNGRWRLLTSDAGSGALVPLMGTGTVSGYYYVESQGQANYELLKLRGELPDQAVWSGHVSFAAAGDALQLTDGSSTSSVYARATPSPYDAADNPSPTTDGRCSMVGTWGVPAIDDPSAPLPAAVFSFDGAGNFVGVHESTDTAGTDFCSTMSGTYALSASAFQLVTSTGLGYCDGDYSAGYTATFDASCDQVSLTRIYDDCSNNRGYFGGPTTLIRRPPEEDGGASMAGDAGNATPPIFGPDCWASQLPAVPMPGISQATVADICAAAASSTTWGYVPFPPEVIDDYRQYVVGRWAACGPTIAELPAHAAIELGANGRWRLLAIDPGNGSLVPLSAAGATSGYYYALSHDSNQNDGPLVLVTELPSANTRTFLVRYSGDAIRFDDQGGSAGPVYARAAASADNGADNPPPTADGPCSMAGTWDVVTIGDPLGAPPAVIAFDQAGNFIGGPPSYDLCKYDQIYGSYALSSGMFQLTSAVHMGQCNWYMRADYTATFDSTCNHLSIIRISDACHGGRGYFDEPTTLTRRVPPGGSP